MSSLSQGDALETELLAVRQHDTQTRLMLAGSPSPCSMRAENRGVKMDHMKLWQIAVLIYAVIYFMLAGIMEADNLRQSYPVTYVAFSMIAQTLVVGGVVLFALEKAPRVRQSMAMAVSAAGAWSSQSASPLIPPTNLIPTVF